MFLEKALTRRLIFVTGKGGVGKSTIAAAVAKAWASLRKRTALVELDVENVLYRHFSISPAPEQIHDISPYLSLYKFQANYVLEEFISEKFHSKGVYKLFFDNRFVNYFLNATPGFNEFLIMGKLWRLAEHDLTPYDTVIVDAPATGHALALLEVPHIVTEAIHSGPLKHLAAQSLDLITNPEKTGIIIVSSPEEMPATEAVLIKEEASKLEISTLGLMINRINPAFPHDYDAKAIPAKYSEVIKNVGKNLKAINKGQKTHLNFLKKTFDKNILEIPVIEELDEAKISEKIANAIKKSYE